MCISAGEAFLRNNKAFPQEIECHLTRSASLELRLQGLGLNLECLALTNKPVDCIPRCLQFNGTAPPDMPATWRAESSAIATESKGSPMIPIRATEPSIEIFTWPHAHDAHGDPRCLGRRPYPVSMARVPLNTPPHLHAASAGPAVAPRTPCRPRLATNPPPRRPRRPCPIRSNARLRAVKTEPGADPQGREPAGSWTSARPGSMEHGNPRQATLAEVRIRPSDSIIPPPLPLMSDGDQQGRRCLVQDAPSPRLPRESCLPAPLHDLSPPDSPFAPSTSPSATGRRRHA